MAPCTAPASPQNLYLEGYSNSVYRPLPPAMQSCSESDSDLGSFKSIKSSIFHLEHSTLPVIGNTRSLILPSTPNYPHNHSDSPGLSRSKSHSAVDRHKSSTNQPSPIFHLKQSRISNSPGPRLSPTSESSAYSLKTVPDELENRTNNTKSYESTPALCGPDWDLFKPTIDKALLELNHPADLEGYVRAQSFPDPSHLLGSTRSYPKPPPLDGHPSVPPTRSYAPSYDPILYKPQTGFPSSNLTSKSSSFETAPTSPELTSGSFVTAPMSPVAGHTDFDPIIIKSSSDPFAPGYRSIADKGSGNFHELQPQMRNKNADTHRPVSLRPPNTITMNNSLSRPEVGQSIVGDDKGYMTDSSFPRRLDSLLSPPSYIKEPPLRKVPVHNGFVTASMQAAVNEAAALYDSSNALNASEASSNSLSLCLPEALAHRYALVVDAKNAIMLRQSAILADLGIHLESLVPMINLYATDEVKLTNISKDLEDIRQACNNRQIKLRFSDLEWHRSAKHPCGLAFVDHRRYQEFSWKESTMAIDESSDAQASGLRFIKDPAALIENRLPKLRSRS